MTQPSAPTGSYPFSATLRGSLVPAVIAGAVTAVALGLFRGVGGAVSGLVGVAIAIAFFASGLLLMDKLVRDRNPMLFMAVGMSVYLAQVLVLLGVLVLARRVESLDSRAAGIAMLVTVVVWQIAQLRAWRQARVPVYDTPSESVADTASEGVPDTPSEDAWDTPSGGRAQARGDVP
jgi:ATP synthase protein I